LVGERRDTSSRRVVNVEENKTLLLRQMSSVTQISAGESQPSASDRLSLYLERIQETGNQPIVALTPDASTRSYFRVPWQGGTAIAAVYAESFDPEVHPYLDVTRLFLESAIPVPAIYEVDGESGVIIQEDLGDTSLFRLHESAAEAEVDHYRAQAVELIGRIQHASDRAYELKSIASRLAFDEAKLSWELNFFTEHYFSSLRDEKLRHGQAAELKAELNDVAAELAAAPRVLCHRDFHGANLMVDSNARLRVIDHQDARMGPATYDLVSFLLDRKPGPPSLGELRHYRLLLLDERSRLGLSALDPEDFAREFRLMTVQRGLKAIGTFSYQTAVCGRGAVYQQFIKPTFEIVLQAAEWLERLPTLRKMIAAQLNSN